MKARYITYISLLLLVVLNACSNIDEGERLIFVGSVDSTTVIKHVLIEDFTGQSCINCPAATDLIKELQGTYGEENLIAVGIYSGPFGQTVSGRLYPLTTETGNYYYDKLGVSVQPVAMIDRHTPNVVTATWSAEVYNAIQEEAILSLNISNEYSEKEREVSIDVEGVCTEAVNGRLQVWLVEDDIVDWQYLEDGSVDDNYVHNHVFRATVNDQDGDSFIVAEGDTATRTFTATLDEEWIAENVSVVAFVFNDNGVLQVSKSPVVNVALVDSETDDQ